MRQLPLTEEELSHAHRKHWWRLVAQTTRYAHDPAIAEDAVAAAFEEAVRSWPRDGVPESVFAWLMTVARNRAIDAIRKNAITAERERAIARLSQLATDQPSLDEEVHMMALCAHPALSETSQACAMLRFVCGIRTDQLAGASFVPTATMAARLTRAKKTLAQHQADLFTVDSADLITRVPVIRRAVLAAWTLGHTATVGADLTAPEIAQAAVRQARVLARWSPDDETRALAAACEFSAARWATRESGTGQVTLQHADRDRWNWSLVDQAEGRLAPLSVDSGPFRLRAEIERLHTVRRWADVPWGSLVDVYARLLSVHPDPVLALGRCVAQSYALGPRVGLADLGAVVAEPAGRTLLRYPYTHAAAADMCARLGENGAAARAYATAALNARTEAERQYFTEAANRAS